MRDISLFLCYNGMRIKELIIRKTVFIGHRKIFSKTLGKRLLDTITEEIQMGVYHRDFLDNIKD